MIELNETFFIQLVNFFVMVFFLNHFLFKPILAVVDRRNKKLKSLAAETHRCKTGAEKAIAEYDAKMVEMKKETAAVLAESRQKAASEQEKIISEARKVFSLQVEEAKKNIGAQMEEASQKLRSDAEDISRKMASKLLGREI